MSVGEVVLSGYVGGEVVITSPQPLLYVQPDSVTKVENWWFQHLCKSLCKRLCSLEV